MIANKNYVFGKSNVLVPAHLNFGKFMLDRIRSYGDKIALVNAKTDEQLSYKNLTQFAVDFAYALTGLGVKKGEVVGFGSEKRNEYMTTVLAVIFTGATLTFVEFKNGRARLQHQLELTKPKYFICTDIFWTTHKETLNSFEFIKTFITLDGAHDCSFNVKKLIKKSLDVDSFEPPEVQGSNDIAIIQYSSGTTGLSKGVMITHLNCIVNSLAEDCKDESLQVAWIEGEWYHSYDAFFTLGLYFLGRTVLYHPEYTNENVIHDIDRYGVNMALMVPSTVTYLSTSKSTEEYNVDSLKLIISGAGPLHTKTIEKIRERFPKLKNILQCYGMTEIGEITSEMWVTKHLKPGSVGMVTPGITIKVVDVNNQDVLGPNQSGEIYVRGPALMKGYIGGDVNTYNYIDEEGFFKTGDLGYYDDDRYFYIIGRTKETISYNGYKVAPQDLERLIINHPGVQDAGVVGKPHPDLEELPTAFVVRQPGNSVTEEELIKYVDSEVAHYMKLRGGVRFVEEIPRNQRKKIVRHRLREMLNE